MEQSPATSAPQKRALISVSDKSGVLEFAKGLSELGFEILSTGGTAGALRDAGISVKDVSEVTGFEEFLDGRVKTLHPAIHGGILAMRENEKHMREVGRLGIGLIDLVCINLYPFKKTIQDKNVLLENAIENIDIGGPTMIRAAAKNWEDVVVVIDPGDYHSVLEKLGEKGGVDADMRYDLACKVFEHTAAYDALVASYLRQQQDNSPLFPASLTLTFDRVQSMRHGENPHQRAAFYKEATGRAVGVSNAVQLGGKELSFNNVNDLNLALDVLKEFSVVLPSAVVVRNANPAGVGFGDTLHDAYMEAYEASPGSVSGGIVAVNRQVDLAVAERMSEIAVAVVIAPAYAPEALELLRRTKDLRILRLPELQEQNHFGMIDLKKVAGGLLVQELDIEIYNERDIRTVTKRAPTKRELTQLLMAWRVVKHVKSNAIVLFKGNSTVGVGAGQTGRMTALELAIKYAGEHAEGSVMASDAFFPSRDCIDAARVAGITAIIQPGGSPVDQESIDACDEAGIAMVLTGMRHFKH